jgi:hypothetical protein
MRFLLIAIAAFAAFQLAGCGGSGRRLEQTFSLEQAPSASNDAGVTAKVTYYKQSDHYLIVKASLTNSGKDTVVFKNSEGGNTMSGFRATIDGQTYLAVRHGAGYWSPWTGYVPRPGAASSDLELPSGITTSIELRWDFQVPKKDYAWTVIFSNQQIGDKKIGDIAVSYPPAGVVPAK